MGTTETPPPFFPLLPSPGLSNENGFWPQARPQEEYDGPQFKRHRPSDDTHVLTDPNRSWQHAPGILSSAPPPPNPRRIPPRAVRGAVQVWFVPYGQNCSFAHGPEELRRPPPNWPSLAAGHDDDRMSGNVTDRQRLNKLKICRKYYNGEDCPYGERCTFAHVEPGSLRESSAISVGVTETAPPAPGSGGSGSQEPDASGSSSCGDANGSLQKSSSYWKTKMNHKWEPTESRKYGGLIDAEASTGAAPSRHLSPPEADPASRPRGFLRLRGLRKISNIYADWIDD
ncbi:unnamed protein product [Spirodela intermedia]|uniref:C3H1-type domain-containing protein n=1 Tax=Spirodela intermedia TaxID=51605 RepID=A0A7I8JR87_SPIIN|nr:unnamed protein product [Spirodela intermedia]CAA6672678.1 unnamed protein product [Spirodela intermedia]